MNTRHKRIVRRSKARAVTDCINYPVLANYVLCGLVAVLVVCVLGWVGNRDMQTALIEDMQSTCEYSASVVDRLSEQDCGILIDRVQAEGYEVLSKDGHFWAEHK